ncbi:hypothetical protein Tco_1572150 [Tanacetum coccineum]
MDSLLAQRLAEEEELSEQQKKRRAQVQFKAQHYTEEFDKLVKQVESFAPINFEAIKDSLKRFGEELQTKTSKRLKSDEAKDDEPTKKSGKRRKQMARKGLHTDLDKDDSEDSDEVSEQDDSVSGTKIPVNPVPVAMKSPSIATYKIIKQGEKGVYQIIREDETNIVYINFGAMLKDISRDDLTELYRIVMNRYGMDGPEDELEKSTLFAEVQLTALHNILANEQQHTEQSEPSYDTHLLETIDNNTTSTNMCHRGGEIDQDALLKTELLKMKDMVDKEIYNELSK